MGRAAVVSCVAATGASAVEEAGVVGVGAAGVGAEILLQGKKVLGGWEGSWRAVGEDEKAWVFGRLAHKIVVGARRTS